MKLKFENLGVIKSGEIDLSKELTILTGGNNTGKSYVSYLLYGLYRSLNNENKKKLNNLIHPFIEISDKYPEIEMKINIKKHFNNIVVELINSYEKNLNDNLYSLFASKQVKPLILFSFSEKQRANVLKTISSLKASGNADYMKKSKLHLNDGIFTFKSLFNKEFDKNMALSIAKDSLSENLIGVLFSKMKFYGDYFGKDYNRFFPAERSSINLFSKEIIQNKAQKLDLISAMSKEERNDIRLKINFPLPINEYLYFINNLKDSFLYESEYKYIADEIEVLIGGAVSLNEFDEMVFKPVKSTKQLDLHISSSTVKSLAGLVFYFRYYAMKDDVIFIDEPELNLHPDNQRNIARIIAKAINGGIKVVLSTHSDYIIRELNNLIMLNQKSKIAKDLAEKYKYSKDELLDYNIIGAYICKNNKINKIPVDDVGFEVETIDKEINKLNETSQDIYFSLFD